MTIAERVYSIIKKIPKGKVATYGRIAKLVHIKNPRYVGRVLHKNSDPKHIPCHRVVTSEGKVAVRFVFGGAKGHSVRLRKEGVEVKNGTVDLSRFLWKTK